MRLNVRYDGFLEALYRLETLPDSHAIADENDDFLFTIRELHYGLSSRPTHRAVYTIVGDCVIVLLFATPPRIASLRAIFPNRPAIIDWLRSTDRKGESRLPLA